MIFLALLCAWFSGALCLLAGYLPQHQIGVAMRSAFLLAVLAVVCVL